MKNGLLILFFFALFSENSYAATNHWYDTLADAQAACIAKYGSAGGNCGGAYNSSTVSYCSPGPGTLSYYRDVNTTDLYLSCLNGYVACPSGQSYDYTKSPPSCVTTVAPTCPAGQAYETGSTCHTVTCDSTYQVFNEVVKTCIGTGITPPSSCASPSFPQVNYVAKPTDPSFSCVSICASPSIKSNDNVCYQNPAAGPVNSAGASTINQAKSAAQTNQTNAATAKAAIDSAVTQKTTASNDAQTALTNALNSYNTIKNDPNSTQAQKDAALQNYAQAVVNANNATSAKNAAVSAQGAAVTAQQQIADDITTIGHAVDPGNATALGNDTGTQYQGILTDLNNGIAGYNTVLPGAPVGSGTGTSSDPGTDNLNGPKTSGSGDYPGLPDSFYTSAYPDGITGIWNANKSALSQTSFISAIGKLTPQLGGDSGNCPTWSIDLSAMRLGSQSFDVPCWIFSALRVFFLITTLFTARAIIFGG